MHRPNPMRDWTSRSRLNLQESDARTPVAVRCFYCIAHQALEFEDIEMQAGAGGYETIVSGNSKEAPWDLMIFFEFKSHDGTSIRWPHCRTGTPYQVLPTQ
ncbi:MAG: hypothetical protein OXK78_21200 [Caldilineaceae bacterium]|nr:hypothetical protein [Caldilineaceae bacterium]